MTFATLILDSLYAGLLLIAAGWFLDLFQARHRGRAARLRACDSSLDLGGWARGPRAPHFAREGRSTWVR